MMDFASPVLTAPPTAAAARDDIVNAIANQAANVRRTFEAHQSKRKRTVSSATTAAAEHMASLNRKRKMVDQLALRARAAAAASTTNAVVEHTSAEHWGQPSLGVALDGPFSGFARPEKVRVVSSDSSGAGDTPAANQMAAPVPSRVSDGITLKAYPHDITVSYNDVVCGKGKATTSLVGNQRFKVWIGMHKDAFAKAPQEEDRRQVACSVVNAVSSSLPQGRFLSLDIHTGLWYDVGYNRAVGITMELLMAETGMMWNMGLAARSPVSRYAKGTSPRVFASKAA